MADNSVFITGTSSGAFTEAFNDLPPWATEVTALQIEKYLRKSFDVQSKIFDQLKKCCTGSGGGAGKMSAEDTKKVNDELEKLSKNLKRNNEEDAKKRKREKEIEKAEKEGLTRDKKKKASDEILNQALAGLAAAGTAVIGVNKDYIDVYDSLYQSGINVLNGNNSTASGFEALNQMVNQTGLRLQTLQKVVEKYSTTVNAVGMAKFAKTLSMSNSRLQELGYSSEAQAELIGTLMESEAGYTDIRNKTAAQLSADAIKLGAQMGRLSLTVGMTREQLQENLKATSKSTESAFVFAKFGKEAADKLDAATAGIKDSGLRDTFMQLAAAANPAQVKGYNELVQAGLGDVAEQMNSLAKAGMHMDPVEFQKRLSSLTSYLESQTGRMGNLTNLIGNGGDEAARILNSLYQQGRGVSQATDGQMNNATKTEATIAKLQTEVESLAATLQKAFFPLEQQVDLVTAGLKKMNSAIDGVIASINAETRSWIGVGIAIAGLIATLTLGKGAINTFFSMFGKAGEVLSGTTRTLSGPIKFIGNLLMSAGKSLGSAISGVMKAFGGIGSVLARMGSIFLRFAGPVGALYAAFQLGVSIGETIMEMITGVKTSVDFLGTLGMIVDDVTEVFKSIWKSISEFASGIGSLISTKFNEFTTWVSGAFKIVLDGVTSIGQAILGYLPWLNTVGEYITKGVNVLKSIVNTVTDGATQILNFIKKFVSGVANKFMNKMTFGLVGSDESEFTENSKDKKEEPTEAETAQEMARFMSKTPMKPPSEISIPKSPAATTINSPSAVPAEPPTSDTSKSNETPASGTTVAGIDRPGKGADINSLLVNQGLLLEQILMGTNSLVSVNKDILMYARNSA